MKKYIDNMLSELLETVNLYICSKDDTALVVHDWDEDLNYTLNYPVNYYTNDKKRYIEINSLDSLKIGNIDHFSIDTNFCEDKISFMINDGEYVYNACFDDKNTLYRVSNNGDIIDLSYLKTPNTRSLKLYGYNRDNKEATSFIFDENIEDENHFAKIIIFKNNEEIFRLSLPENEIDIIFDAILSKTGGIFKKVNTSIRDLNSNMYDLLIEHYDYLSAILKKSETIVDLPIIEEMFLKYFEFSIMNNQKNREKVYINNKN